VRGRAVVAVAVVLLVLAAGWADAYLGGLARDNLTNAGFHRQHERTPADFGIASQDVRIPSDGRLLAGWWMPAAPGSANASATVVLVHGLGSTMGKVVRLWAPNLHAAGYSLLALDLRNHGASPDTPDGLVTYGTDEADDVAAAVEWVQDHAAELGVDPDRVVLYGGSMGAATVILGGSRELPGVAAVVADSSYASFAFQARVDGAKKGYPAWLVGLVVAKMDAVAPDPPSRSRPEEAVRSIEVPLLLLHCADDARVTRPNFDRLAQAARERGPIPPPDTMTWVEPCPAGISPDHHLDGAFQPGYNETVLRFLDSEVAHPVCCRL
jgi:alpha-beta hydrolase superfamily lysophospholipase